MCLRVVEQFSVCRCVYYIHGVDQCNSYGMRGHYIQDKVVLVGHTCRDHSYGTTSSQTSSSQSSPSGPAVLLGRRFTGQAGGIGSQIRQLQEQQELYEQQRREAAAIAYMTQQQQQQYYTQYNGYSR